LGLAGSLTKFHCIYCFSERNAREPDLQERTLEKALQFAKKQEKGHLFEPMVKLKWLQFKLCILHGLMSFGRQTADFIFRNAVHCQLLEQSKVENSFHRFQNVSS